MLQKQPSSQIFLKSASSEQNQKDIDCFFFHCFGNAEFAYETERQTDTIFRIRINMDLKVCGHTLQPDKKVSPNYTVPDMRFRPRAMENSPRSSQVFSHIFRTLVI